MLSTGEVRIADKLAENGQRARAGQQVRLIDVPADAVVGLGVFDNVGAEDGAKMLAEALQSPRKALMGRLGRNSCGASLPTAMTRWPTPSKP